MTILRTTVQWSRPRKKPRRVPDLTPQERACVKEALRFLLHRERSWSAVAKLLGVETLAPKEAAKPRANPSAGIALRVARAVGVSIEDVLTGRWPGVCPTCGRSAT